MARIVIVAKPGEVFEFIEYNLDREGHCVHLQPSPFIPNSKLNELRPDLLLADVGPESLSAVGQLCERIQTNPKTRRCRILIVKPAGLDECDLSLVLASARILEHPLRPRTFMRRVREVLVSSASTRFEGKIKLHGLTINPVSFTVTTCGGKAIKLTRQEFRLMHHLASHPNEFCSRDELLETLRADPRGLRFYIDSVLRSLKTKLEPGSEGCYSIRILPSKGCRFETRGGPASGATRDN
jgi:two-component system phosphate regulon response regulator PhoB